MADCWLAGIPDVLLQSKASFGACFSTSAQRSILKGAFSGPDSWTMVAFWTAEGREVAMFMEEMSMLGRELGDCDWVWEMSWDGKYLGSSARTYPATSGRVS